MTRNTNQYRGFRFRGDVIRGDFRGEREEKIQRKRFLVQNTDTSQHMGPKHHLPKIDPIYGIPDRFSARIGH